MDDNQGHNPWTRQQPASAPMPAHPQPPAPWAGQTQQPAPAPMPVHPQPPVPWAGQTQQPAPAPMPAHPQPPAPWAGQTQQPAPTGGLGARFADVVASERGSLSRGRYILRVTNPYETKQSQKDGRTIHKVGLSVVWTPDGHTVGDTAAIWKENRFPQYARGDVKAYMCALLGKKNPTAQELDEILNMAGAFIGCQVTEREITNSQGQQRTVTDYKWIHVPEEVQAALRAGTATVEQLTSIIG